MSTTQENKMNTESAPASEHEAPVTRRVYPVEVMSHWEHCFPEMQASSQRVYEDIEKGVRDLQLPGVTIERALRSQGGILSKEREYLQIRRERIIFEVCAAPFGPNLFFISWRLSHILRMVNFAFVAICFVVSLFFYFLFLASYDSGTSFWAAFMIFISCTFWKAKELPEILEDLHNLMLRLPLVGRIWGMLIRPETYYRIDTAMAFRSAIHDVVLRVADDIIKESGGSPLLPDERKPILSRLFGNG